MKKELLTSSKNQQWIKRKGKEKIQSFQDSFAEFFKLSLCLMSLEGKALTVWSNSCLLCHYMKKNNNERCVQEHEKVIQQVINKKKAYIFTCYVGLTSFACPVFHDGNIIAIYFGGAVCLEQNKQLLNNKITQNITILSKKTLEDIINMLENILDIWNIDENTVHVTRPTKVESKYELFFLENRLSVREIEVVKLINAGLTNKEIGLQLNISEKTVKAHVSNILKKLRVKDRMHLVILCKQNNVF